MRDGDTRRRDVIRYLRSVIKNVEIERRRELSDDEILGVIRAQLKQRRESIDIFAKAQRADLVANEEAQIAVLEPYLPAQLDDNELRALVSRVADELNVSAPRDMGRLMPALLDVAAGRVDGRRLSEAARSEIAARATPAESDG